MYLPNRRHCGRARRGAANNAGVGAHRSSFSFSVGVQLCWLILSLTVSAAPLWCHLCHPVSACLSALSAPASIWPVHRRQPSTQEPSASRHVGRLFGAGAEEVVQAAHADDTSDEG